MLRHQVEYKAWKAKCEEEKREYGPEHRGLLVFDEVKIRGGCMMNPSSNLTDGFCMEVEELHNLADVYTHIGGGEQPVCQYVMTSMWRCLDSPFEVLGPIMASPKGLNSRAIHKYVWRCIEEFHQAGFQTDMTVCDGATPNLAFVKINCPNTDPLSGPAIQPFCYNRFTGRVLFMVFDPPHGLKTKRNSCLSSFPSTGTRHYSISVALLRRCLEKMLNDRNLSSADLATSDAVSATDKTPPSETDRVYFGYREILDVYNRQEGLRKGGAAPQARFLTRDTVFPNQWTKMRVWMAKAWFCDTTVAHIIWELLNTRPGDLSLQALAVFCDAMQSIYLDGLMSPKTADSMEHECLTSILNGLDFVLAWRAEVMDLQLTKDQRNQSFMAPITFQELLVTCIGVLKFGEARFAENKKVSFRRISQSRLEAVFSEIRSYASGGLTCSSFLRGYATVSFLWESDAIEGAEERYLELKIE
jgi:hypothetical protein